MIRTRQELLDTVRDLAERQDLSDELLQSFLNLTESAITRELRVPTMERREILIVANGALVIPNTLLELKSLTYLSDPTGRHISLERGGRTRFNDTLHAERPPRYFQRVASQYLLDGNANDGDEVEIHYYSIIPSIRDEGDEGSWLLSTSPEVYLASMLGWVYDYLMIPERAEYWNNKFAMYIGKLQVQADNAEWAGTRLQVRNTVV